MIRVSAGLRNPAKKEICIAQVLQVVSRAEAFRHYLVFIDIQYLLMLTVLSRSASLVTAVATLMLLDFFQLMVMESHSLLYTLLFLQNEKKKAGK